MHQIAAFILLASASLISGSVLAQSENVITENSSFETVEPSLQILSADGLTLEDYLWEARIIAVLADTPSDPAFLRQLRNIEEQSNALLERDVIVITDTNPASRSPLRQRLRARGFMLAIIDKDGEIKQRRPSPRTAREIIASIDSFPLRRQEMLEQRPSGR